MKTPLPLIVLCALALPLVAEEPVADATMMKTWLEPHVLKALDSRQAAFEKALTTPEAMAEWQAERKAFFLRQLGGFPERTPLKAQITGRQEFEGYRIEKVILESQPGLHVTGTLYLPEGKGPHPVALHPTGHSSNGKARDLYQQASIVIARGGCAVFCYDPIGQGERKQFFNEKGETIYGSTQQHQLIHQGLVLLGSNTAQIMVWDGMRVMDYLQTRDDIDPERIGCTGISGGGTNTSYLMALDERVQVAAPGCYLTGFRSLLTTIGPQDAEQNIHGQISFGMDHSDYVLIRAPKPTLIMAATKDYFSIEGAWELFREGKRFYTSMGFPEHVDLVEPDEEHGFSPLMRSSARDWMRRWFEVESPIFQGDDADPLSPPFLPDEELYCTPEGQVLRMAGARSAMEVTREWADQFADERAENWQSENREASLAKVRELIGAGELEDLPEPEIKLKRVQISSQRPSTMQGSIVSEAGILLPFTLHIPTQSGVTVQAGADGMRIPALDRATIYLHEEGKDAIPESVLKELLETGQAVMAVDLRGLGSTAPEPGRKSYMEILGVDWSDTSVAMLLGKSYVGMRTVDIWQCARFLAEQDLSEPPSIIAQGLTSVPARHAFALEPGLFSGLETEGGLESWQEVVDAEIPIGFQSSLVFGAFRHYDLPDLVAE